MYSVIQRNIPRQIFVAEIWGDAVNNKTITALQFSMLYLDHEHHKFSIFFHYLHSFFFKNRSITNYIIRRKYLLFFQVYQFSQNAVLIFLKKCKQILKL